MKYYCKSCGAEYSGWQGKCNVCEEWGVIEKKENAKREPEELLNTKALSISEIESKEDKKIQTTLRTFDNVLGGGLVPSQVVLLAGEPGIGKSTLLTQICRDANFKILYVSGEESLHQIKQRFLRIGTEEDFRNVSFQENRYLEAILKAIESNLYDLIIVDSIQTITSLETDKSIVSNAQIKYYTEKIVDCIKRTDKVLIMVGQINKEGDIAGPKLIEHMVDTVLYFQGDTKNNTRVLRVYKNRFGSINEIAVYEMHKNGLIEVNNLEKYFTSSIDNVTPGVSFTIHSEGNSYIIIEIQALCVKTYFNYPKRVSNGIDNKRLELIIAILSKKLGLELENYDIYVNLVGGLEIDDTGLDLAISAAIISSIKDKPIIERSCLIGEITLTGEIRECHNQTNRINKARKFGLTNVIHHKNLKFINDIYPMIFRS